jgi:RimJ/RimL family protein N-acetyltransferase
VHGVKSPAPLTAIPRLTTARLLLRELRMPDFEAYAANLADPAATRFMGGLRDRRAAWRAFAAQTGTWFLNGGGWWAVEEREGGEIVGTVGAFFRETDEALVELGWSLFPAHWGHGFATEAARAALGYAFDAHDAPRVVAHITAGNVASIGVTRHLGMKYEADVDFYGETIGRYAILRGTG